MSNETVSAVDEATKLLADLREMLEAGGRFVLEQAPPLAREMVVYGRAYHTIAVIVSMALIAIGMYILAVLAPRWCANEKNRNKSNELRSQFVIRIALSVPVTIGGIVVFLDNISQLIMAWTAPRLYIVSCIRRMM